MCLQLISCFEVFLNGEFSKALSDINSLIDVLRCTEMDTFFKPISDVCFHLVHSTQAYMRAFLNENVQQVINR